MLDMTCTWTCNACGRQDAEGKGWWCPELRRCNSTEVAAGPTSVPGVQPGGVHLCPECAARTLERWHVTLPSSLRAAVGETLPPRHDQGDGTCGQ